MPPATLREKYYEAHDLIVKAWTEPEVFAFNGKYNSSCATSTSGPGRCSSRTRRSRSPRRQHRDLGVDDAHELRLPPTYRTSAAAAAARVMKGYWNKVEELGGDDNPYRAGFAQIVAVANTDAEAERLYRPHAEFFFNNRLHVYNGFAGGAGLPHHRHDQGRHPRPDERPGAPSAPTSPGSKWSSRATSSPAHPPRCAISCATPSLACALPGSCC
ncbi:MAG: hypothetical protein U0531_18160 [Dehalococcoidia bacterium]